MHRQIIAVLFIVVISLAFSQGGTVRFSPRLLNYQGYLTDTLGNPITNPSVSMIFAIFDAVSAGNQKWTETQASVAVDKGIFHVLLGSVTPIPDSVFTASATRYLQLSVAGQTLSPRTRIVSTPYAYASTYSDTAQYSRNSAPDNDWTRAGNKVHTYYLTDSIGLGTPSPKARLDIAASGVNTVAIKTRADVDLAAHSVDDLEFGFVDSMTGALVTRAMNIVSSGNVGIGTGTDNPLGKLDVANGSIWLSQLGTTSSQGLIFGETTANIFSIIYDGVGAGVENKLLFNTTLGGGTIMAMKGDGLVGIGTASPLCKLDVRGVVCGGAADTVKAVYGGILSGYSNLAGDAADDTAAVVGGGYNNTATGRYSFIGGGFYNTAGGNYATVAGGRSNNANGYGANVGGGVNNLAPRSYATIGGGYGNNADTNYATIGGGCENDADGYYTTVGGGYRNTASNSLAIVGGGTYNTASGYCATVAGGYMNLADTFYATVGGGCSNAARGNGATVGGGRNNLADSYATIGGGYGDTAMASTSFATNYSTKVNATDTNSAAFTTSHTIAANQVRAASFSTGTLDFAMDHPADPANKILNQYGVGSDEVTLMYSGSIILDAGGRAVVMLPDYFDDINRNPRIQLTGVGSPDVAYVAEKINNNRFVAGGKPGMEVYWTVIAERKDIHAEIARIQTPVVQEKTGDLRNHSIDDDAMVGIYDRIKPTNQVLLVFKTEEGRSVHEQSKRLAETEN